MSALLAERIAEEVHVERATEIPVGALERFYERMYPAAKASFLKENWRWLYRLGTYPEVSAPFVAVRGDEVVGHAGLIPVTLRRAGVERTAIWFVDFGVLPECQRMGVGVALTQRWMQACPLQITFCNERSIGVFLKYGWEARFHTQSFKLVLRPERHGALRGSSKRALALAAGLATRAVCRARTFSRQELIESPATAEHLEYFSAPNAVSGLHVPRSEAFLHWRVTAHPRTDEYVILHSSTHHSEEVSAIARVSEVGGYKRLHILALRGGKTGRALSEFFAGVVRWALKEELDHIWYVTSDPEVARCVKWWLPMHNSVRFACHANDASGTEFLSGADHFWEGLDSDFDLAFV